MESLVVIVLIPIYSSKNRANLFLVKKKDSYYLTNILEDSIYYFPIEKQTLQTINGTWISVEASWYTEINGFPVIRKSIT